MTAQVGLLLCDDREERRTEPSHIRRLAMLRDVTASRVVELLAAQSARSIVEERYLEGRAALFPDDVLGWAERLQLAQEVALMTERLADLDGVPPAAPADPDAVSKRARLLVPDLVEPARVVALEKLDETRRAFTIAIDWLRSKAQVSDADASDTSPPEATSL
jgi:hypothetical protein